MGIRIDALDPVAAATKAMLLAEMVGSKTSKVSIQQISDLFMADIIGVSVPILTTQADADQFVVVDAAGVLKRITLANELANIFKTTRKIPNAYFDTSLRLWDNTDLTKGLSLNLSGLTTATVRSLRVPDGDVSLSKWEFIRAIDVTGSPSVIDITGLANFRNVKLTGWLTATGASSPVCVRVSPNNGTSFDSGATDYPVQVANFTGAASSVATASTDKIQMGAGGGMTSLLFEAIFSNMNQAIVTQMKMTGYGTDNSSNTFIGMNGGQRASATIHNALRLLLPAGTFGTSHILVEGER